MEHTEEQLHCNVLEISNSQAITRDDHPNGYLFNQVIHLTGEVASESASVPTNSTPETNEQSASPETTESSAKSKRIRTNYTPQQLEILEITYMQNNRYPNTEIRELVASTLGLKDSQVRIWFQNRRAKDKRRSTSLVIPSLPANTTFLSSNEQAKRESDLLNNNAHQPNRAIHVPQMPFYTHGHNIPVPQHVANLRNFDLMFPRMMTSRQHESLYRPTNVNPGFAAAMPAQAVLNTPPNATNLFNFDWKRQHTLKSEQPESNPMLVPSNSPIVYPNLFPNAFMPSDLMSLSPPFLTAQNSVDFQTRTQPHLAENLYPTSYSLSSNMTHNSTQNQMYSYSPHYSEANSNSTVSPPSQQCPQEFQTSNATDIFVTASPYHNEQ